jgi:hypothetical protein
MKTKHQTLLLMSTQYGVQSHDLVRQFGYSPGTSRSYLSHLGRQALVTRIGQGYVLTERGHSQLQYFELTGCGDPVCPRCEGKAGKFTCPRCKHQLPIQKARILPERDFLVVRRSAGVFCPRCFKPLLSEAQAELLKIPQESKS